MIKQQLVVMSFYNRIAAVNYARKWALSRNPASYNYDEIGGDCTNFISQCLYAGKREMNYRKYGWYYNNPNNKSASWTGVEYLSKFLLNNKYEGPRGILIEKNELEIGDIIQFSFDGVIFGHSLFVTEINGDKIKICTHTMDAKNRNFDNYNYKKARFIKIK